MALEHLDGLQLPAAADMHVHLRDGAMMELVVYVLTYRNYKQKLTKADLPSAREELTWSS